MKRIILILLLVAAGCGGGTTEVPNIYTGTKGLTLDLIKNSPPDEVLEDSNFLAGIRVSNQGPTDIYGGVLALGIEEDFVEIMGWDQEAYDLDLFPIDYFRSTFQINGKTMDNPIPHEGIVMINLKARELPEQSAVHETLVTATACYSYKTILNQEICIDSDLFDTGNGVEVCQSKDISLSSQGGPVAITRIEPTMNPSEDGTRIAPYFRITVKNSGSGAVVSSDSALSCSSSSLYRDDVNEIKIKANLFGKPLRCSPQEFKLDKNTGYTVTCELPSGVDSNQDTYMSMLIVELDYGYTFTISKNVKIKRR